MLLQFLERPLIDKMCVGMIHETTDLNIQENAPYSFLLIVCPQN